MNKVLTILILALVTLISSNTSFAEDLEFACAAVYPCDEDGNLLERFADPDSECFDYYVTQCTHAKILALSDKLKFCEFSKVDQESQIATLQDELKRKNRRNRKLRRRLQKRK